MNLGSTHDYVEVVHLVLIGCPKVDAGEENEVGTSSKICHLIKLVKPCNWKEEQLSENIKQIISLSNNDINDQLLGDKMLKESNHFRSNFILK